MGLPKGERGCSKVSKVIARSPICRGAADSLGVKLGDGEVSHFFLRTNLRSVCSVVLEEEMKVGKLKRPTRTTLKHSHTASKLGFYLEQRRLEKFKHDSCWRVVVQFLVWNAEAVVGDGRDALQRLQSIKDATFGGLRLIIEETITGETWRQFRSFVVVCVASGTMVARLDHRVGGVP